MDIAKIKFSNNELKQAMEDLKKINVEIEIKEKEKSKKLLNNDSGQPVGELKGEGKQNFIVNKNCKYRKQKF